MGAARNDPKPAPVTGRRLWVAALVGAVAVTAATAWWLRPSPARARRGPARGHRASHNGSRPRWLSHRMGSNWRSPRLPMASPVCGCGRSMPHRRGRWREPRTRGSRSGRPTAARSGSPPRVGSNASTSTAAPSGCWYRAWAQARGARTARSCSTGDRARGLYRVSADGGEPGTATRIDLLANDPRRPQFLPDPRHFIFYETGAMPGIYVGQLGSSDVPRRLLDAQAATYAPGHLIFVRQRTLFAQPFDPVRLELSGNPTVVAEQLVVGEDPGAAAALSASAAGPMVYRTGPAGTRSQFVWFDRSGKVLEAVAGSDIGDGFNSSLSPDERRLAFSRFTDDAPGRTGDIWLLDLARGVASRFTSHPMFDLTPVWSPDGNRLAFSSNRTRADGSTGSFDVYVKAATSLGNEEWLVGHDFGDPPSDWSPDGRFILYHRGSGDATNDIWALPLDGDREPFPVVGPSSARPTDSSLPTASGSPFNRMSPGRSKCMSSPFRVRDGERGFPAMGATRPAGGTMAESSSI